MFSQQNNTTNPTGAANQSTLAWLYIIENTAATFYLSQTIRATASQLSMRSTFLSNRRISKQRSITSRSLIRTVTVLVVTLIAGAYYPVTAQMGPRTETVLTDSEAYLLLPPELISGPVVAQATSSQSGRNLAVLRMSMRLSAENIPSAAAPNPPPPSQQYELIFWNAAIRKPTSLWQSSQPFTNVRFTDWMPTTETLFAIADRVIPPDPSQPSRPPAHEWKVLLLGLGIERAVPLSVPLGDYSLVQVEMSPRKPLGVLELISDSSAQSEALYLVHPNGRMGARIDVPASARYVVGWDSEGNPTVVNISAGPQGARAVGVVDPRNGHVSPMPKEQPRPEIIRPAQITGPLRIVTKRHSLTESNTTQQTNPIWLESPTKTDNPRALLTADGTDATFVPGGTGVRFQSQNAYWFTPVLKMNKEAYMTARRAAERMVALSNAKQLGLAAIMFAQDNDEVLPSPDGIQEKLMPYLQNTALFSSFTYTYAGGAMSDIVSPSETILGYVAGPGGHAVLYADGHAKWQNDHP